MSKCIFCGCELTTGELGGICNQCRLSGFGKIQNPRVFGPPPGPFDPPPEYPPYDTPVPSTEGWICPRCKSVHAPFVRHCYCSPPSITTTDTQIKINFP